MRRFRNILAVVDEGSFSDAVLARAAWLARSNAARLTLVDSKGDEPGEIARLLAVLPGRRAAQVEAQLGAARAERLEALARKLRDDGAEVATRTLVGSAFVEIIRQVLRDGHDLVLKGADRAADMPFLRAPDLHLLRKAPCPVWILNGPTAAKSVHIAAAVDPDPGDPVRDGLNRTVMELATSLARNDGARLDVLNAWHVQEEAVLRHGLVKIPEEDVHAIVAAEEHNSRQRFDALTGPFEADNPQMRLHHLKGIAAEVVPGFVAQEKVDTLVMGTVGRTGIPGFFIGNTAETILGQVGCSVLAVKPAGFRSPVTLDDGTRSR